MLYTPSHAELAQHPKTRKLARMLGVSIPAALGHLHLLWHFALKYAPDGDLSRFDNAEIADGCLWEGEPDALVGALCAASWIDQTAEGDTIHDWEEHGGKLVNRKEANAQRMREARAKQPPRTKEPRATHVQRTTAACVEPEERRLEEKRGEESIFPPNPPLGGQGGGAAAPHNIPTRLTARPSVPKPKEEPPPRRPPDLLFEAVCEACAIDWHQLTDSERGKVNAATGQIRKTGATPPDVRAHAENYALHFTTPLTPSALAGNWAKTANAPPARASPGRQGGESNAEARERRMLETIWGKPHGPPDIQPEPLEARFSVVRRSDPGAD